MSTFSMSIHRPRLITVKAFRAGDTRWVLIEIDDHEVTIFAASPEQFDVMCEQFNIATPLEDVR